MTKIFYGLDQECVYAIWEMAKEGDPQAVAIEKQPVEMLYAFAVRVVDGIADSEFAHRVLARATAMRMGAS